MNTKASDIYSAEVKAADELLDVLRWFVRDYRDVPQDSVTYADVAGMAEVLASLQTVVDNMSAGR